MASSLGVTPRRLHGLRKISVEPEVVALSTQQFLVRSALDNATLIHVQDQIRALNRAQPVRNHETRSTREQPNERRLKAQFSEGIHGTRRFIQD